MLRTMVRCRRWMLLAALSCTTLTRASEVHGGGSLGVGVGVPFTTATAGVKLGLKAWVDFGVAPDLTLGLALPLQFGFYSTASGLVNAGLNTVDILPSLRCALRLSDLVGSYVEFGGGPSIVTAHANGSVLGINISQAQSQTSGAFRMALGLELTPPSLQGFLVDLEPAAFHVRLGDNTFSEYTFLVAVGYRH